MTLVLAKKYHKKKLAHKISLIMKAIAIMLVTLGQYACQVVELPRPAERWANEQGMLKKVYQNLDIARDAEEAARQMVMLLFVRPHLECRWQADRL